MLTCAHLLSTRARAGQISEEIMDLLHSFGDFQTFKDLMVDYKKVIALCQ